MRSLSLSILMVLFFIFLFGRVPLFSYDFESPRLSSGQDQGWQTPDELFSTEKPIILPDNMKRGLAEKGEDHNRQGLTLNGLGGLAYTETTDQFEPHRLVFGTTYSYTPWNYRYDHKFSPTEEGALQSWRGSIMYPTTNGQIAVTVPYHYYNLSAPRLFGTAATDHAGIGDVIIAGKLTWFPPKRYYRFAAGAIMEFPTGHGRSLRPAGVTDEESVKLYAAVSTKETKDFRAHAQLGYGFHQDGFDVYFYNLAVDYLLTKKSMFMAEFIGSEGPSGFGSNLDFVPSVRVAFSDAFSGTFSVPFNLYNDREFGYDYTLHISSMYRW